MKRVALGVITLLVIASAVGFGAWRFFNPRVAVRDIKADPPAYNGKVVVVRGKVDTSISISSANFGGYQINDGTGSIWVVQRRGTVPASGTEVTVRGTVNFAFQLGPITAMAIVVKGEKR